MHRRAARRGGSDIFARVVSVSFGLATGHIFYGRARPEPAPVLMFQLRVQRELHTFSVSTPVLGFFVELLVSGCAMLARA